MVKGLPRGVNSLPSALQLKMAWSVSKLQWTRSQRCVGGLAGPMVGGLAGAAGAPRRPPPLPVLSSICSVVPSAVFTTPIQA